MFSSPTVVPLFPLLAIGRLFSLVAKFISNWLKENKSIFAAVKSVPPIAVLMLFIVRSATPFLEWPDGEAGVKKHASSEVSPNMKPDPAMYHPWVRARLKMELSWSVSRIRGIPFLLKTASSARMISITLRLLKGSSMVNRLIRSTHTKTPIIMLLFCRVAPPPCGASFTHGIMSIWKRPPDIPRWSMAFSLISPKWPFLNDILRNLHKRQASILLHITRFWLQVEKALMKCCKVRGLPRWDSFLVDGLSRTTWFLCAALNTQSNIGDFGSNGTKSRDIPILSKLRINCSDLFWFPDILFFISKIPSWSTQFCLTHFSGRFFFTSRFDRIVRNLSTLLAVFSKLVLSLNKWSGLILVTSVGYKKSLLGLTYSRSNPRKSFITYFSRVFGICIKVSKFLSTTPLRSFVLIRSATRWNWAPRPLK